VNAPGELRVPPNVTIAELPFRQCAAVVTTRGWINVAVQLFTITVLGHWQVVTGSPPTTAAVVMPTPDGSDVLGSAGPSSHAYAAQARTNEAKSRARVALIDWTACMSWMPLG
jgi:hypothetical protein